jgi:hypothetical protein
MKCVKRAAPTLRNTNPGNLLILATFSYVSVNVYIDSFGLALRLLSLNPETKKNKIHQSP